MKIPVGKTLEAAFNFGLKSFLSVLGVVWFPLFVTIALIAGAAILTVGGLHGTFPNPRLDAMGFLRALAHLGGLIGACWVLFMIAGAMIQVGLLRKALGLHPGPVFIYFSLGADVWRMVGAMLVLFVVLTGLAIAVTIAGFAIWSLTQNYMAGPERYLIDGLAIFALACAYIYAFVRFSYFLPVVVVAEGNIGIGRSWSLAGGNFWRIVLIVLVIALAVNIVASMVSSIVAPSFMMTFNQQTDPGQAWRHFVAYMSSVGPPLAIIYFLQTVLLYGLLAGAAASAYRAVTPPPPSEGLQPA